MSDTKNLEEEIRECILLFSNYLGIENPISPNITFQGENLDVGGSYCPNTDTINITPSEIKHGATYFEEIAHYLRHQIKGTTEIIDTEIEEFFGRLGEEVGRNLTCRTKYSYLFDAIAPRSFSDLNNFSELFENRVSYFYPVFPIGGTTITKTKELFDILKENYTKNKALVEEYSKNHNLLFFIHESKRLRNSLADILQSENIECSVPCTMQLKEYIKETRDLRYDELANFKKMPVEYIVSEIEYHLDILKMYLDYYEEDLNLSLKIHKSNDFGTCADTAHFLGYTAAERYIQSKQARMEEIKDLFWLSDSQIRAQYLNKSCIGDYQGVMEKIVESHRLEHISEIQEILSLLSCN